MRAADVLTLVTLLIVTALTIVSYYFEGTWDILGFKAHPMVHMNLMALIVIPIISLIYGIYTYKYRGEMSG